MDIRNVYIIFDRESFSKDDIKKDLKSEGYKHNFFIPDGLDFTVMRYVDEVWIFGDCSKSYALAYAKQQGKDIWNMA